MRFKGSWIGGGPYMTPLGMGGVHSLGTVYEQRRLRGWQQSIAYWATLGTNITTYSNYGYGDDSVYTSAYSGWTGALGSSGKSAGKYYYEVGLSSLNFGTPGEDYCVGVATGSMTLDGQILGYDTDAFGYNPGAQLFHNNAGSVGYGDPVSGYETIGIAMDMDNGELTFYINGASQGVAAYFTPGATYYPAITVYNEQTYTAVAKFIEQYQGLFLSGFVPWP